ncbi:MAG: rhomboid family intramembrane serine protease [Planctomycetaceae bacterium]|nr:rhomboid family intramembrane serine protease [Planctomycetaceae bacterium]
MGIESREYLRGGSGPRAFSGGGDVVTKIIIANVVIMVLQLIWTRPLVVETEFGRVAVPGATESVVQSWLQLEGDDIFRRFQLWRLITYAFCHDRHSVFHILINMYVLYLVGRRLESVYGSREFLLFYLTAAVVSGLAFLLMELTFDPGVPVIGASGAVAAAFIAYAMRYPDEVWRLFGLVPVQVKWLCGLYLVFDLYPVLQQIGGVRGNSGVAHAAHLGGYLFGFLYERNHWQLSGLVSWWRMPTWKLPRRRSHLRVYQPEEEFQNLDSQVDELLQKVHEHGEASLTEKERAILSEASRRYRNRL